MKNIRRKSKRYIHCQHCHKNAAMISKHVAADGRPQYQCTSCNAKWTNGNPYLKK